MKCAECGSQLHPGARFCGGCGARVAPTRACGGCGAANPVENSFCHDCGERLAAMPRVREVEAGERRQITVLFCDIVGSTTLSTRVDAEDLQQLLKAYYQACRRVVERFDGHIANYLGDGVMVYFGHPRAHEDDAVRAVHAALAMLETMGEVREKALAKAPGLAEQPLAVRIGIHTGMVVVGGKGLGATPEGSAVGDTLNIAAKLQSSATPDSIVISAATQTLVQGLFVLEDHGDAAVAGLDAPIHVYRVLRPSGVVGRIDVAAAKGLTKFIGRTLEVNYLLERWGHAAEGLGQAVLVSGDAGVGKSRLLQSMRARLANRPHVWLEAAGSPYHTASAFHPVIELIERGISIEAGDSAATRIEKLEQALALVNLPLDGYLPLFAQLISLPVPERYVQPDTQTQSWRRRTFEALLAWVFALAETNPLIFVIEDVQWVDPSSLEFFGMMIEQAPTGRVLVLMTSRPEFQSPWQRYSHLSHLKLAPLTQKQAQRLIETLLGESSLSPATIQSLVEQCDGVPLFAEELTKAVLEGVNAVERVIPTTLQDSLTARLDLLGPAAKEVAQIASVLGREFSHATLVAIADLADADLERALDILGDADLLYRRGIAPRAVYLFKHALIQETAYESLLRSRRIDLHARVASAMEKGQPDAEALEPELIAFHHEKAQHYETAIQLYAQAGRLAKERAANAEAAEHFRNALALIEHLPESQQRNNDELRLLVGIGSPLIVTRGYADEEVRSTFERARALCEQVGDERDQFEAVYGHSAYCLNRTEMERARYLSRRLIDLASRIPQPSPRAWAHQQMGCVVYWCGDPGAGLREFDSAVAAYDPETQAPLIHIFGQDPRVASTALAGMTNWLVGRVDIARAASLRAVEMARAVRHPFSLGFALAFAGYNHVQLREPAEVRRFAEEALALSDEHGIRQWNISANFLLGWAMDNPAEGIAKIESTFAVAQQVGSRIGAPFQVCMLADRQFEAGRVDSAAKTVQFGLALARDTQNRFWDAALQRLAGDIALHRDASNLDEAARWYRTALDTAHAQRARSLELRAAVSCAALALDRGDKSAAAAFLSPGLDDVWRCTDSVDARAAAEIVAAAS